MRNSRGTGEQLPGNATRAVPSAAPLEAHTHGQLPRLFYRDADGWVPQWSQPVVHQSMGYYGDWLNGTWDTNDGELQLDEDEPERMECDAIVVTDDDLHWEALVKNCDIQCETEYVNIADLIGACTCNNTPKPWRCPLHGENGTSQGGNPDERLRNRSNARLFKHREP